MNQRLGIHFINKDVQDLYEKNSGVQESGSTGFDLVNIEEVKFNYKTPFQMINLGVIIKPPAGFHSILIPRSSTFKKFRIIQVNHLGLIDESFCGIKDVWKLPALWISQGTPEENEAGYNWVIPKGSRICQFFIQPKYIFETYNFTPLDLSRGGDGSTGH